MITQPQYKAIIGTIFVLFSLVFFILLFEGQYRVHKRVTAELGEVLIRKGFAEDEYLQLRQDVSSMNNVVNSMATQIGEFIIRGNRINDTIVSFMNQAEANQNTLDSLGILESALLKNDVMIDSLNKIFEKRSDSLLLLMNDFERTELNVRLYEASIKGHKDDLWFTKLFMLVYLFLLSVGLVSGIYLLIRGFK